MLVKASLCPVLREFFLILISHLLTYFFLLRWVARGMIFELKFNCNYFLEILIVILIQFIPIVITSEEVGAFREGASSIT